MKGASPGHGYPIQNPPSPIAVVVGLQRFGWHRNADSSVESLKERGWRDGGDSEATLNPEPWTMQDCGSELSFFWRASYQVVRIHVFMFRKVAKCCTTMELCSLPHNLALNSFRDHLECIRGYPKS